MLTVILVLAAVNVAAVAIAWLVGREKGFNDRDRALAKQQELARRARIQQHREDWIANHPDLHRRGVPAPPTEESLLVVLREGEKPGWLDD